MSNRTKRTKNELERLRLPELQARFREVTGETSRSPNRKFLIRRIEETLAARAEEAAAVRTEPREGRELVETAGGTSAPPRQRGRFASMTVEELQAKYLEVVGRATGSDDKRYLMWKIREAEKGRIPVGPRKTRERDGEPLEVKILPLRLEADVADKMDEAWRARGIKNRMEFFRGAIGAFLTQLGARDVAALFANPGPTSA
jgi:hypothetical protein